MKPVVSVRSGMGLGDSLYLQSVARHLIRRQGYRVEVCSKWPDVFIPLGDDVFVSPFRRNNIDRLAHYSLRKWSTTDQFVDCCLTAGIKEAVELKLDWEGKVIGLDQPIVLVQLPREPMDRKDGYGTELLPTREAYQEAINVLRGRAYLILVGKGEPVYQVDGIDWDLSNKTSVVDLLNLANSADALLGYVSFFVPLAESLDKPLLCLWSERGLQSKTDYIRTITPQKIFHKGTSRAITDGSSKTEIERAALALVEERRCPALV